MKILSNKTYNNLLEERGHRADFYKKCYEDLFHLHNNARKKQFKALKENALNFRIRKVICGLKATGKTTLIKEKVIPQLKNYFLIDLFGEYDNVPDNNKFVWDRENPINRGFFDKKCSSLIKENKDKIIIIDGIDAYLDSFDWFFNLVESENLDYVITKQYYKDIDKHFDLIDNVLWFDGGLFKNLELSFTNALYFNKFVKLNETKL